jgi:hypothetical protein
MHGEVEPQWKEKGEGRSSRGTVDWGRNRQLELELSEKIEMTEVADLNRGGRRGGGSQRHASMGRSCAVAVVRPEP